MNGVYLRELPPDKYAETLIEYVREQGYDWEEQRIRAAAPLVQEKIARLGEFPEFAGFLFHDVEPDPAVLDPGDPHRRGRHARGRRAVHGRPDRDGAEGAVRAPWSEAAAGVPADPCGRNGLEDLARPL